MFIVRYIKQDGFTIIELLIAMVISLTLIFACASVYTSLQNSISISQSLSNAQESLRTAHFLMSRSVRQGYGIELSGANGTIDRQMIITYGGPSANGSVFHGCLGQQLPEGATDTYYIGTDNENKKHLFCATKVNAGAPVESEIIALYVQSLSASLATSPKKGVDVNLAITGMPGDMETNGYTFSLAMRQRILIDAGTVGESGNSL